MLWCQLQGQGKTHLLSLPCPANLVCLRVVPKPPQVTASCLSPASPNSEANFVPSPTDGPSGIHLSWPSAQGIPLGHAHRSTEGQTQGANGGFLEEGRQPLSALIPPLQEGKDSLRGGVCVGRGGDRRGSSVVQLPAATSTVRVWRLLEGSLGPRMAVLRLRFH